MLGGQCFSASRRPWGPVEGRRAAGLILALLLFPLSGAARDAASISIPSAITIPRLNRAPVLEDFVSMEPNGEVNGQMGAVEGFVQQNPRDGQPSSQRTVVYFGYDQKNLYVVFVCFDSEPQKIRARMTPREQVFSDDRIEVMLDTFRDQRRAYVFTTNPFGIQRDALWTEAQGFDGSFDTLWHSRGRLTEQGYVVWLAIPFKSLRFPSTPAQKWGIVFKRDIPRLDEAAFWPRVSSRIEGRLSQAATAHGLESISPGRNIQFIPYGVFRSFRALDTRDPSRPEFVTDHGEFDAGLDAKVVLKDSLVLDVTLNPDFSHVESDEPQVTVNQRFEVFFPERRPFFIENADFFETPIDLVFTRRIADPSLGARLTGKVGPYALGLMVMDDESPGKIVPRPDPLHDQRAYFGIFRVSRDIFQQSRVGFIYTDREFEDSYNRVGGFDGRFKLSPNWVFNWQAVTSWTRTLEGERFAGPAYDLELFRSGRSFEYQLEYNDRSPGFRTETGFIPRSDIRRIGQWIAYRFWPENSFMINWGPRLNFERVYGHDGTRLDWQVSPSLAFDFVGQTSMTVFYNAARERLRPQDFPGLTQPLDFARPGYGFDFSSSYFRPVTFFGFAGWGKGVNFAPPCFPNPPEPDCAFIDPFPADENSAELGVTLHPLNALRIDNSYILFRLQDRPSGATILNNNIFRSRWNYQFTRELSLRVILQYDATLTNPELTSLETRKNFNADFLLTYLLHPGTALFIGYNGNVQNIFLCNGPGQTRFDCPFLSADTAELIRLRRQYINDARLFFIKFSYLYRF